MSSSSESHGTHDLNGPTKDTSDVVARLTDADALADFVRKLRNFEQAYSGDFFRPLSQSERMDIGPILLSRASADMGRHLAKFFVEAADAIESLADRAHYAEGTAQANIDRASEAERLLAEARATIDLIREEAGKDNSPLGRSDSLAVERIRAALSIGGGNG